MKLYTTALVVMLAVTQLVVVHAEKEVLRGTTEERKLDGDCPFAQLFSNLNLGACMVVSGGGRNSRVRLGRDCSSICPPDEDGLMRKEGTQLCLQVSHGEVVEDGSKLRLYPCDKDDELQQFTWIDDSDPHRLKLKSSKYKKYCATNRGRKAAIGDPIIFKVCDDLRPKERQTWWGD